MLHRTYKSHVDQSELPAVTSNQALGREKAKQNRAGGYRRDAHINHAAEQCRSDRICSGNRGRCPTAVFLLRFLRCHADPELARMN